jgi:hypothetical protein
VLCSSPPVTRTRFVGGSAWEATPWPATQRAAWQALNNRGRILNRGLRIFAVVWIWAIVVLVIGGNRAFIYFADSKMDALWRVRDDMNPFNVSGWFIKILLASPGLAAFWLSERLKRRTTSAERR